MWKSFLVIRILILRIYSLLPQSLKTTWWWKKPVGNNSWSSTEVVLQVKSALLESWLEAGLGILCLGGWFSLALDTCASSVQGAARAPQVPLLYVFLIMLTVQFSLPVLPCEHFLPLKCRHWLEQESPTSHLPIWAHCGVQWEVCFLLPGGVDKHENCLSPQLMLPFGIWTLSAILIWFLNGILFLVHTSVFVARTRWGSRIKGKHHLKLPSETSHLR